MALFLSYTGMIVYAWQPQQNLFTGPLKIKHTQLLQFFGLLLLTLFLGACERSTEVPEASTALPVETTTPDNADQRLAVFFDEIFERDLSQNPELQAYLGRKTEDYGRWDDYSDEFSQIQNQQAAADLERLHTEFDYAVLPGWLAPRQ